MIFLVGSVLALIAISPEPLQQSPSTGLSQPQIGDEISVSVSKQQPVPAPGKERCEIAGGLWGIWGNVVPVVLTCNPSTSDVGMECSDSSQCQSFCQAKEGAQIGIEDTGMCYGYELAICLQEVRNGVVEPEWCQ